MSEPYITEDHPLALELESLKNAVTKHQHEAHASSVKLQRHSLDATRALEQTRFLERENLRLREEVATLRAHPDTAPSTAALQVPQLTLALRKLSDKLTLTEHSLLSRTNELLAAQNALRQAKHDLDSTHILLGQTRSRVDAYDVRERELEKRVRAAEEERKMSDLVVQEYADLVRSLEGRSKQSSRSSLPLGTESNGSTVTLADTLAEGKLGLQKLLEEFNGESERLASDISALHSQVEDLTAQLQTERKSAEEDRSSLASALVELNKYKSDDNTAAKMVSRYMKFSQSTTDSLQRTMENLRTRQTATLATLNTQINGLQKALLSERQQSESLRCTLDDLSEDLSREAYGRRREISLRLAFLSREEYLAESLRRWARKSKESFNRLFAHVTPPTDTEALVRVVFDAVMQDAEGLLEWLNGQPALTDYSPGSLARVVAAQDAVLTLTKELQIETDRRLQAETQLIHQCSVEPPLVPIESPYPTPSVPIESPAHKFVAAPTDPPVVEPPSHPQTPPSTNGPTPEPPIDEVKIISVVVPIVEVLDTPKAESPVLEVTEVEVLSTNPEVDPQSANVLSPAAATLNSSTSPVSPISPHALDIRPLAAEEIVQISNIQPLAVEEFEQKPHSRANGGAFQDDLEPPTEDIALMPFVEVRGEQSQPPSVTDEVSTPPAVPFSPPAIPPLLSSLPLLDPEVVTEIVEELQSREITGPCKSPDLKDLEPEAEVPDIPQIVVEPTEAVEEQPVAEAVDSPVVPAGDAPPPVTPPSAVAEMAEVDSSPMDAPPLTRTPEPAVEETPLRILSDEDLDDITQEAPPISSQSSEVGLGANDTSEQSLSPTSPLELAKEEPPLVLCTSKNRVAPPSPLDLVPIEEDPPVPSISLPPSPQPVTVTFPAFENGHAKPEDAKSSLLADLVPVKHRYDDLQKAFRDCDLALKELKKDVTSVSSDHPLFSILQTAVERLNDFNEDARVELEIRVADEERIYAGYETLLLIPGAISDEVDEGEIMREVTAFIDGSDKTVTKSLQKFTKQLEDLQHDIASLKRSIHDPPSEPEPPTPPALPISAPPKSPAWSSWAGGLLGSPRPSTPTTPPARTFGSVMTSPRLRHTSFSHFTSNSLTHSSRSTTEPSTPNPFASLGLRISMPLHIPVASTLPNYTYLPSVSIPDTQIGDGPPRPLKARASSASAMYMLGLGARGGSFGLGGAGRTVSMPGKGSPGLVGNAGLSAGAGAGKGFPRVDDTLEEDLDSDVE